MTYYAATRGLAHIGIPDDDARIVCDSCGMRRAALTPRSKGPPKWLLDGKSPPGWTGRAATSETVRADFCPRCNGQR